MQVENWIPHLHTEGYLSVLRRCLIVRRSCPSVRSVVHMTGDREWHNLKQSMSVKQVAVNLLQFFMHPADGRVFDTGCTEIMLLIILDSIHYHVLWILLNYLNGFNKLYIRDGVEINWVKHSIQFPKNWLNANIKMQNLINGTFMTNVFTSPSYQYPHTSCWWSQSQNRFRFHPLKEVFSPKTTFDWFISVISTLALVQKNRADIINRNELGIKINIKIKLNKNKISYLTCLQFSHKAINEDGEKDDGARCDAVAYTSFRVCLSTDQAEDQRSSGQPYRVGTTILTSRLGFSELPAALSVRRCDRLTAFYGTGKSYKSCWEVFLHKKVKHFATCLFMGMNGINEQRSGWVQIIQSSGVDKT